MNHTIHRMNCNMNLHNRKSGNVRAVKLDVTKLVKL